MYLDLLQSTQLTARRSPLPLFAFAATSLCSPSIVPVNISLALDTRTRLVIDTDQDELRQWRDGGLSKHLLSLQFTVYILNMLPDGKRCWRADVGEKDILNTSCSNHYVKFTTYNVLCPALYYVLDKNMYILLICSSCHRVEELVLNQSWLKAERGEGGGQLKNNFLKSLPT